MEFRMLMQWIAQAKRDYYENLKQHAMEGETAKAAHCSGFLEALEWVIELPDMLEKHYAKSSN